MASEYVVKVYGDKGVGKTSLIRNLNGREIEFQWGVNIIRAEEINKPPMMVSYFDLLYGGNIFCFNINDKNTYKYLDFTAELIEINPIPYIYVATHLDMFSPEAQFRAKYISAESNTHVAISNTTGDGIEDL